MTDIIENAGQPENTAPAAGEKKPENTPKKEKQPMTFKRLYKEWILPFGLEILALFLIVKFVFFVPIVPTGSMEPTIAEHSALFALRVHDLEKLERGDIIVFTAETPELAGTTLIKRLIGLPGDHVEIDENGTVTIDEIKTTTVPYEEITEELNPCHWAQGMVYAAIFSSQQGLLSLIHI